MYYIMCVIADIRRFEKLFLQNSFLQTDTVKVIPVRKSNKASVGSQYNKFLENMPEDAQWLCFVTDAVEFRQSPQEVLQHASEDSLYGVFGARAVRNNEGTFFRECQGSITESVPENVAHVLYNKAPSHDAEPLVDALDSRCLFVPARLASAHGLRFDGALELLYGEGLCLNALDSFGVKSRIIHLDVVLHEPFFYSPTAIEADLALLSSQHGKEKLRACAHAWLGAGSASEECLVSKKVRKDEAKNYSYSVDKRNYNMASVLAAKMLCKESCILDAGCAAGHNGGFFKTQLSATLYGLDYSRTSLEMAQRKNVYERLDLADLNTFVPADFPRYYRFFDSILLLDVLEHLYSPEEVLHKLEPFLKPGGSFVLSLPNLGHMSPVLSLINKEFRYQEYGILDATHIRFFTWKSLASSLASWGFRVEACTATFLAPNKAYSITPVSVPLAVIEDLLQNRHSLALQYVCQCAPSKESFAELKAHNMSLLDASVNNNPAGWNSIVADIAAFRDRARLASGSMLEDKKRQRIAELFKNDRAAESLLLSDFYDEGWYRKEYDEVDFTEIHPLQHYIETGWKEGKSPSEAFDSPWYQKYFSRLLPGDLCPLLFHLSHGIHENYPHNRKCFEASREELVRYAQHIVTQESSYTSSFVAMKGQPYEAKEGDPKVVAFYLPQFSPFPENDEWWGKGFTEWTNATKALPLYAGHYQPHLPYDLGFYDLRLKETCLRQEELARFYGVHGFCYHYYWFDGKKIMDSPIAEKLRDKTMSLPFCLSWANEPWSANWDGSRNNLLLDQPKTIRTEALFYDLLPFFQDDRYIRIHGKPFFMMYRPTYFDAHVVKGFMLEFQSLARKNGLPGLHFAVGMTGPGVLLESFGADAYVEFPPHGFSSEVKRSVRFCNPKTTGVCYDLPEAIAAYKKRLHEHTPTYRTVFPMWDNSARRAEKGATIFEGASPEVYFDWLQWCMQENSKEAKDPDSNIVFVNAWNEWAEGAHLEPDRKYGYAFLEMTKKALYAAREKHNR